MNSRHTTRKHTFGKNIRVVFASTLVAVAVNGCSLPGDYRLAEACRVDQETGEFANRQWCDQVRETVSEEVAYKEEMEQRRSDEATRIASRQAAANRPPVISKETQEANAIESRKALMSWNIEHQLAIQENNVNLQEYPDIAVFSGVWCWGGEAIGGFQRNEILDDGRIRSVMFRRVGTQEYIYPASTKENILVVRRDGSRIFVTPILGERSETEIFMTDENAYFHHQTFTRCK